MVSVDDIFPPERLTASIRLKIRSEAQRAAPDANFGAGLELGALDAIAIDEGAVGAVQIFDEKTATFVGDGGVMARGFVVGDDDVGDFAHAADDGERFADRVTRTASFDDELGLHARRQRRDARRPSGET